MERACCADRPRPGSPGLETALARLLDHRPATCTLADGIADKVDTSAEMLDKHPLYPGLTLA